VADENQEKTAKSTVFGVRMTQEEMAALEQAASTAGESAAQYVRKAVSMREQGRPLVPVVNFSVGAQFTQVDTWTAWTEARGSTTPDDFPAQVDNITKQQAGQ
jgi:hypothetical protein